MPVSSRNLRQLAAVVVAATLLLAGCGGDDDGARALSGPTTDSGCGFSSGPYSEAVEVDGDFGGEVEVSFDEPFEPRGLERTVLAQGEGRTTRDGTVVTATVSLFNGRNGDLINRQSTRTTVGESTAAPVLAAGVRCVPIGSRVVAVAPASELFGEAGSEENGIGPEDGVVVVTDVQDLVKPPKAQQWPDAPEVTFNGRRSPQVITPTQTAPSEVLVKVLRPGNGAVVRDGDQVTVDFKIVVWGSGKLVQETYGKGSAPVTFSTNDFVPGFTSALVGQRGGARVVAAVPPEFAYGPLGAEAAGVTGDDTLLIVIEILAVKAAAPPTPAG